MRGYVVTIVVVCALTSLLLINRQDSMMFELKRPRFQAPIPKLFIPTNQEQRSHPSEPKKMMAKVKNAKKTCKSNDKTITILFWNSFWIWPDYGMGLGNAGFLEHNCSCSNCHTTTDRKQAAVADAIIFHGQTLPEANMEYLRKLKEQRQLRGTGRPLFIYYQKESPK